MRVAALAFAFVFEGVEHSLCQEVEIGAGKAQHSKVPLALVIPPDLVLQNVAFQLDCLSVFFVGVPEIIGTVGTLHQS